MSGSTYSNSGQKLWDRAKYIIPGGNMLLSKRPEIFLPNKWPAYFKKAKNCFVTDWDNKKYLDMSLMGKKLIIFHYQKHSKKKLYLFTKNMMVGFVIPQV